MIKIFDMELSTVYFGNTISSYIYSIVALVATFIIGEFIFIFLRKISGRLVSPSSSNAFIAAVTLDHKFQVFIKYLPFYIATKSLVLPDEVHKVIAALGIVIGVFVLTRHITDIIGAFLQDYSQKEGANKLGANSAKLISKIAIWAIATLFVLSNLGFNVNTLIAGLGIGGMAIALASQTVLSDLFNYFAIVFDKPFNIGDAITVSGNTGRVKFIGLKGTRIVSSNGEEIIISNTEITKSVLRNFNVMERRLSSSRILIKQSTEWETVKRIPEMLKNIVESAEDTEFIRSNITGFEPGSIVFELVFFVNSKEYSVYASTVHAINIGILEKFNNEKISFYEPVSVTV